MITRSALALALLAACACAPATGGSPTGGSSPAAGVVAVRADSVVRPGIETFLADVPARLRGKRVGLITNQTAVDRERRTDIDLIAAHPQLKLVALLAPEHGIRGTVAAGRDDPATTVDAKTGVPIYSLYTAEDRGPTPEMLKDVDVIVYDLQEVGGRTWTYVSTMALVDAGGEAEGDPVRRARPPEPDRRRDRRGRAARPEVQVVRRDVPDPGAPRDDGRRARDAVQREVRHRRRPDRGARGELAALAVAGPDGAAVGEPLAQPALARRADELPGHRCTSRGRRSPRGAATRRARSSRSARRGSTRRRSWRR